MNTTKTIHDLTVAYIEQSLGEVKLLHDATLIDPTLAKFNIQRSHAFMSGFALKPRKFRLRAGLKRRASYALLDVDGSSLGSPIHEDDLGAQFTEAVIERVIAANLAVMLADHADLVALHKAGDGGREPSYRYNPASGLAERSVSIGDLERQKNEAHERIEELHEQNAFEQNRLRELLTRKTEAESARDKAKLDARQLLHLAKKAQRVIDQAARIQEREALKQDSPSSSPDKVPTKEASARALE
ncbi:hypothetical protein [Salinibacterium sp. SWN167]|uniref:hypothetical protein n=1 Tax=Salinibacterium sp. SWN167 TaxID=2792054 RepID=UPI0018CC99C6|nr:hypothetical protein [Salinibacterium sp. SWN167]MBH0083007.1 hypothetical protein [Salinibacterium sp. SWN167]